MRIAFFSPLPPMRSGIAGYSVSVLGALKGAHEFTLFTEPEVVRTHSLVGVYPTYAYADFAKVAEEQPFDLCVYQMGNHVVHKEIWQRAVQTPGLVVLHELVLHDLIYMSTVAEGNNQAYVEEMAFCYGEAGRSMAERRLRGELELNHIDYPLCGRLVHTAAGIVAHSHYVVDHVRQIRPDVPTFVVPLPFNDEGHGSERVSRASLGLPEEAVVFGSFGFVAAHKRIRVALDAFKKLLNDCPNAFFVIVGEPLVDVASMVRERGLQDHVKIVGYADSLAFARYLHAVDVCVNLRYPTAGETSGALIRILGEGVPAIVSDVGTFRELPEDVCFRVPVGGREVELLHAHMSRLALDEPLRRTMAARGVEYIRNSSAMTHTAEGYHAAFQGISFWQAVGQLQEHLVDRVAERLVDVGLTADDQGVVKSLARALGSLGIARQ